MRAEYLEDLKKLKNEKQISLDAREFHHLIKVARVKKGEGVLLMDGLGLAMKTAVIEINKKEILLEVEEQKTISKRYFIDLALCLNKKDAMDDLFKVATELGAHKIIPTSSEYSFHKFEYNDRVKRLMISAMKQSNNSILPEVDELTELANIKFNEYDHVMCFSMMQNSDGIQELSDKDRILIIIGPEGGLSNADEEMLSSLSNCSFIHLPTPILRATTALPIAYGTVLTHYSKV